MSHDLGPVLGCLNERQRQDALVGAVPKHVERGSFLHLAGALPDRVNLVLDGLVKFEITDADGATTITGLAVPGDLVGDIALLRGEEHLDDACAITDCDVLSLVGDNLLRAVSASPGAALQLAHDIADRAARAQRTIGDRDAQVPARIAGRILDLAEALGRVRRGVIEVELPLCQRELGRLSGTSRESASKTLARFRREGLIDYEGPRLRIHRIDALERIRCAGRAAGPSPSRGAGGYPRSR